MGTLWLDSQEYEHMTWKAHAVDQSHSLLCISPMSTELNNNVYGRVARRLLRLVYALTHP